MFKFKKKVAPVFFGIVLLITIFFSLVFYLVTSMIDHFDESEISRYKYNNVSTMIEQCPDIKYKAKEYMLNNHISEKEYSDLYNDCGLVGKSKIKLKNIL